MPPKRKGQHFKTCRRCGVTFYGSKYSKICSRCDKSKRVRIKHELETKVSKKIEDKLEGFDVLI